jgi:hypothetical protein
LPFERNLQRYNAGVPGVVTLRQVDRLGNPTVATAAATAAAVAAVGLKCVVALVAVVGLCRLNQVDP